LNTADFLSETDPGHCVRDWRGSLLAALHERKIASDAIQPRYVVVGEGPPPWKGWAAHECIERGARLLATNLTIGARFRAKTRPGAATAALLSPHGRRVHLGKPNGYMFIVPGASCELALNERSRW
jgi:hypothetical protein